jgi:hypothetical protein
MDAEQLERSVSTLVLKWLQKVAADYVPVAGDLIEIKVFPIGYESVIEPPIRYIGVTVEDIGQ